MRWRTNYAAAWLALLTLFLMSSPPATANILFFSGSCNATTCPSSIEVGSTVRFFLNVVLIADPGGTISELGLHLVTGTFLSGDGQTSAWEYAPFGIPNTSPFAHSLFYIYEGSFTYASPGTFSPSFEGSYDVTFLENSSHPCRDPCFAVNQSGPIDFSFPTLTVLSPVAVPGPIIGTGLPGLLLAAFSLLFIFRRQSNSSRSTEPCHG